MTRKIDMWNPLNLFRKSAVPGYPNKLPPKSDERAGDWARRFKETFEEEPTALDFESHGKFAHVKIQKRSDEVNATGAIEYALDLLKNRFNTSDYFVTRDLRIWFTEEEIAMTFKLCWDRT